jgi:GNAT superfamily N-acetyltransferase
MDDVPAIAQIHNESWWAAYRDIFPPEVIRGFSLERRIEQWSGILAGGSSAVHIALMGGEVVGFASARMAAGRDDHPAGEISALYVAPDHWRRGVGRRLLEAAVDSLSAAGFSEATLWVLRDNAPARAFYVHEGWVPDGIEQVLGDTDVVEVRYRRHLT